MKNKEKDTKGIQILLKKLDGIVQWFEDQEEVDVEVGLEKAKEGAVLIQELQGSIKRAENEFQEVKKMLKGTEE